MSALPKRPSLLTQAAQHRLRRALQSFPSSSPVVVPPPPLQPPYPPSTPYPPPPYPALLSLSPHSPPPHAAPRNRPPKKASTTLFPASPPSSPGGSAGGAPAPHRPLRTWGAQALEEEEREARERAEKDRRWTFRAGAAGLPKNGGACITRGGGVVQVGEDCYFVLPDSMGVSDGVGGLKGPRCNPGLFAVSLITHASSLMSPSSSSPPSPSPSPPVPSSQPQPPPPIAERTPVDPHPALLTSHALTLSAFAMEGLHGSATCTLARLYPNEGLLRVAHVGDCELWCVRGERSEQPPLQEKQEQSQEASQDKEKDLRIVFRTPPMQRAFNHPYQLSTPSPPPPAPSASPTPHSHSSPARPSTSPKPPAPEIQTYTLPIQPHDIVLLSSDGLADNLWEDEILSELGSLSLSSTSAQSGKVQEVCERLVRRAKGVAVARKEGDGKSREREQGEGERGTPFERRAREAGKRWRGGKNDDISVVLAVIDELPGASVGSSTADA